MTTEKDIEAYRALKPETESRTMAFDSDVLSAIQTIKTKHRKSKITLSVVLNIEMRKALGLPLKKQ